MKYFHVFVNVFFELPVNINELVEYVQAVC